MGMSEFYGETDDRESIATIHHALDLGVTFFDTADMYGVGRNEELLSRALDGRRDEAIVATKFGNVRGQDGSFQGVNGRPDYVQQACEASLRRLRIPAIDLYYQHRVDPKVPIEETVGAMARLVEQGKVRYLGLSEAGAGTIRRAHATHPIAALQTEYSLWTRDPEVDILATCRELGIGFVPYSPLGRGFLTGRFQKAEDVTAPKDYRRNHPRFQPGALEQNFSDGAWRGRTCKCETCYAGPGGLGLGAGPRRGPGAYSWNQAAQVSGREPGCARYLAIAGRLEKAGRGRPAWRHGRSPLPRATHVRCRDLKASTRW